jgi:hypothetical protein
MWALQVGTEGRLAAGLRRCHVSVARAAAVPDTDIAPRRSCHNRGSTLTGGQTLLKVSARCPTVNAARKRAWREW